jgi:hypothetical protein
VSFVCSICKLKKSADQFGSNGKRVNKLIPASKLREYRCRECNARRVRANRRTPRGQFVMARLIAKRRGIAWGLTFEEYTAFRLLPCHYCGFPTPKTGVSLDRLDYRRGYTPDNVVPCCTECNVIKGAMFTPEEMLRLGAVVTVIKTERAAAGLPLTQGFGAGRPRKYA